MSWNQYRYAQNNPVRYIDPLGRFYVDPSVSGTTDDLVNLGHNVVEPIVNADCADLGQTYANVSLGLNVTGLGILSTYGRINPVAAGAASVSLGITASVFDGAAAVSYLIDFAKTRQTASLINSGLSFSAIPINIFTANVASVALKKSSYGLAYYSTKTGQYANKLQSYNKLLTKTIINSGYSIATYGSTSYEGGGEKELKLFYGNEPLPELFDFGTQELFYK